MADIELIKPRELPAITNAQPTDAVMLDNGVTVGKVTPEQLVNAGAAVASEAEALAGVNNTKRMTPLRVRQVLDNVNNPAVLRAQAWAESSTPPDPLLPDSKSAKTWASIAEQGVVMVQWSMIAEEGQTVLGNDITTGEPIRAYGGVAQISVNGFGPITLEEYSVDSDGVVTLTAPLAEGDVVSGFTQPRLSNSEAQAVVQGVLQQTAGDVAAAQEAADRAETFGWRNMVSVAALVSDTTMTASNTPVGSGLHVNGVGDMVAAASGMVSNGAGLSFSPNGWAIDSSIVPLDSTGLQKLVDYTSPLSMGMVGGNEFTLSSRVNIRDGMRLSGATIVKSFSSASNGALGFDPAALANNVKINDVTFTAEDFYIGSDLTGKIAVFYGDDFDVTGVAVDRYNGFGMSIGGHRHTYTNSRFSNPWTPSSGGTAGANPDGMHISWGSSFSVSGVVGESYDDLFSISGGATAATYDPTIKYVSATNIAGISSHESLVKIDGEAAGNIISDISVSNVSGEAGESASGIVAIRAVGPLSRIGVLNVNATINGPSALGHLFIGASAAGLNSVNVANWSTSGEALSVIRIERFESVNSYINDVSLINFNADGTDIQSHFLSVSTNGIFTDRLKIHGSGVCGPEDGINLLNGTHTDIDIDYKLREVKSGKAALRIQSTTGGVIRISAKGAAGSIGMDIRSTAQGIDFSGSDLSGVTQAFSTRPPAGNCYRNIRGVLADGVGPNLTISDGTVNVTHTNHRIDTEGLAATDILDYIKAIPYLPDGLEVTLSLVSGTRTVTFDNTKALSADSGAMRGAALGLTDSSSMVRFVSRSGCWYQC